MFYEPDYRHDWVPAGLPGDEVEVEVASQRQHKQNNVSYTHTNDQTSPRKTSGKRKA